MKQRFSYLDLKLVVNEIKADLENARLQNIYTLEASARHFLFKFDTKHEGKSFMIVDPGMRLHMTKYQHQATIQPSGFVTKLRKHLRNMRVSKLWVPDGNRVLVVSFGDNQYRLVFEFFSGGNIILTDGQNKTLALMRVVKNMVGEIVYGPGHQLKLEDKTYPEIDRVVIEGIIGKEKIGRAIHAKMSGASLSMVEYCLEKHGIDPKQKQGDIEAILNAVNECSKWFNELVIMTRIPGYILEEGETYLEFEPFREYFEGQVAKNSKLTIKECETYNETVDEYYGSILAGKQENQLDQIHKVAETRLEAAKNERENRLRGLDSVQQQNELMGSALQEHAELVDAAINAVKVLVDQALDWGDIENIIAMEKSRGNPMAQHIHKLDLERDAMVLSLGGDEQDSDDSSDDISGDSSGSARDTSIKVRVKLSQGAWANARDYFSIRRAAGAKKEKTELQADKALKSAEQKIKRDLEKSLAKSAAKSRILHVRRNQYWFEKFYWFLTSDGHIALGGHDSLQNEILLTRYFSKGDVYVHTDISGASVVLIKNDQGTEISPKALNEAAAFTVATSKAWDTKSPGTAWYVTRDQVPRLNKAGNPISVDDVANTIKRNTILPNTFDVGFCLLWETADKESELVDGEISKESDDDDEDSDEEFPDTQLDSDDEFPDTQLDSDEEETSLETPPVPESAASEGERESETPEPSHTPEPSQVLSDEPESSLATAADASLDDDMSSPDPESSPAAETAGEAPGARPKRVRGNKKKLKKYAEQDEEDRKAAMARIGTLKGLDRQEKEQREKEEAKRREQEYKQMRKERARQADLNRIAAEIVEETPFPTNLQATPPPDAQLTGVVPMFGPWACMQGNANKVKVVPGTQKKGKATSEVLRVILDTKQKPTQKQKDLFGGINSNDLQTILPMSRLQVAGQKGAGQKAKSGSATRGQKKKK